MLFTVLSRKGQSFGKARSIQGVFKELELENMNENTIL